MDSSNRRRMFQECVSMVIKNWTALQLALDHGMGGPDGHQLAATLPEFVMQFLDGDGTLDAKDVADELFVLMDTEFKTVCEDNSCEELGQIIWDLFQLCRNGNDMQLQIELQKLKLSSQKVKSSSRDVSRSEALNVEDVRLENITEDVMEEGESDWVTVSSRRKR